MPKALIVDNTVGQSCYMFKQNRNNRAYKVNENACFHNS